MSTTPLYGDLPLDYGQANEDKDYESLQHYSAVLQTIIGTTAEGILVVGKKGEVLLCNERFLQMWNIPENLVQKRDDSELINCVLDQLKEPDEFLNKVESLYEAPLKESRDLIKFKDGRVFERITKPQLVDNNVIGRVWCFRNVTEVFNKQRKLKNLIYENQSLIKELHHRVKNSLALLSSFLSLELENDLNSCDEKQIKRIHNRIFSMAKVYEVIYQAGTFPIIEVKRDFPPIINEVSNETDIKIYTSFDKNIQLPINQAVPCILLVNEFLIKLKEESSNAKKKSIEFSLQNDAEQDLLLSIKQKGYKKSIKDILSDDISSTIIDCLIKQLDATNKEGEEFLVAFPIDGQTDIRCCC